MDGKVKKMNIAELIPDDKNFNMGSEFGKQLLDKSFGKFGAGRSILLDKNNRIIAGNKASESYGELGGEDVLVIETDGKTLVAVKRVDIDLDTKEGRELAAADNATQKADLVWDQEMLKSVSEEFGLNMAEWGIMEWSKDDEEEAKAKEDGFDKKKECIKVLCKPGEIWQLGEHRLTCGDSVQLADVLRFMEGIGNRKSTRHV